MVQMARQDPDVYNAAYSSGGGSGLLAAVRVVLMLALWAAAFVAFLMAPLIVLGVAWIVGLAVLAARHRGASPSSAAPRAPQPHLFGAAREDAEGTR